MQTSEDIKVVLFSITDIILPRVDIAESTVTAWHVNLGWCDEWANEAQYILGGEVIWLEEIFDKLGLNTPEEAPNHAVLFLDGKYYDSMNISGVEDPRNLDFVKGKTLSQWVEDHECMTSCNCRSLMA
jgi:hypothetical protein